MNAWHRTQDDPDPIWYRYESPRQEQRRLFYARVATYCFGAILLIGVWAAAFTLALHEVLR